MKYIKVIGITAAIFIALIAVSSGFMWWIHHETKNLCDRITPGMPYKEMETLLTQSGLMVVRGNKEESPGLWRIYVPDASSVGELACEIEHDRIKVISSQYR